MAKIAFILLCHKDPKAIIEQANRLTAAGDAMAIHFDASSDRAAYAEIKAALGDNPNVAFAKKRIKCGWGEWSLVEATMHAVRAALDAFPRATHFYMLSGDCMPIKSAEYVHDFLDNADKDFIESFDYFASDWIKTGMKEDRLIYRHWFNERGRRDVRRFFKTTWIPDETFFQTLVRHLVPSEEIESRSLTFLMFSDYGMPVSFYNDHYDLLLSQDYLFARKISPGAVELKSRLGTLYASQRMDFETSNEGQTLFKFLTGRGRVGRRFGPRVWERQATLGRERALLVIACKKWHLAKRLLHRIMERTEFESVA